MADIYIQDADGENSDEGVGSEMQQEDGDHDSGSGSQYDFLPPLLRLEKHASSENIYHRQLVGRLILETLPHVADSAADVAAVMAVAFKIADDTDAPVRAELMEQVPHITMLCHEDRDRLHHVVGDHLLPLVVRFLSDTDNQVRKMSHAALLVMMEQGLIELGAVERQVCPVVVMLTELDGLVEYHTGAITLMAKMAPLLGGPKTEELFIPRFIDLCSDHVFYVRRACAANIGDLCAVIGTQATEKLLLERFVALCKDDIWGVRKACAEVVMSVSCMCTMATRKQVLAPAFVALLGDTSRWVRTFAFTTLGPFISTFAEPRITSLAYNQQRELVVVNPDGVEFRLCTSKGGDGDVIVKYVDGSQPYNQNYKYNFSEENPSTLDLDNGYVPNKTSSPTSNLSVINKECDTDEKSSTDAEASTLVDNAETNPVDKTGIGGPDGDKSKEEPINKGNDSSVPILPSYEGKGENIGVAEDNERTEVIGKATAISEPSSKSASINKIISNSSSELDSKSEIKILRSLENVSQRPQPLENADQVIKVTESGGLTHIHVESFNTFQYWRLPIPDISLDICLDGGKAAGVMVTAKVIDQATKTTYASKLDVNMDIDHDLDKLATDLEKGSGASHIRTTSGTTVTEATGKESVRYSGIVQSAMQREVQDWWRDVDVKEGTDRTSWGWDRPPRDPSTQPLVSGVHALLPPPLLDHYVTMTHVTQAQATDNEIAHHCAFSFPAVMATLGAANWPLVRDTYEALASDMQWKVRRTVASSIHEVAVILGEELATKDLVPIFNGFIKDLDEVRIGALKHLSDFLKLLRPNQRNTYLPRLQEFMLTDNEWNWRFREELAKQLYLSVELFAPADSRRFMMPLGISLLADKVSAVRHMALNMVTSVVRHVSTEVSLIRSSLTELAQQFAHSTRWCRRQMFALLCARLVADRVLDDEEFARDVLPHLLDLSWDAVPNVRLAVARTLASPIMDNEYFLSEDSPHSDLMLQVMKRLQHDIDRDVRFFALSATNRVTSVIQTSP